jgi:hypothetical protein
MADACQFQGTATLAEGKAQQSAMYSEADSSIARAAQYGVDGLSTIGGEVHAKLYEGSEGSKPEAVKVSENLKNAEAWEAKLTGGKNESDIMAGAATPKAQELKSSQELNQDERNLVRGLTNKLKSQNKGLKSPEEVLAPKDGEISPETAALERAIDRNSPELDDMKTEVRYQIKQARKASDSQSSQVQNGSQKRRELYRAFGSTFRAGGDMATQQFQRDQGQSKLDGAVMSFVTNSSDTVKRSLDSTAQGRTDELKSFADAQRAIAQSNA